MTGDLAVAYRAPTEAELKGQVRVFFFLSFLRGRSEHPTPLKVRNYKKDKVDRI